MKRVLCMIVHEHNRLFLPYKWLACGRFKMAVTMEYYTAPAMIRLLCSLNTVIIIVKTR